MYERLQPVTRARLCEHAPSFGEAIIKIRRIRENIGNKERKGPTAPKAIDRLQ